MNGLALGIIDAQRGFMAASEGVRLGVGGFGELPVPDGEHIVPAVNLLLAAAATRGLFTFTTQDWHPVSTAHFSETPDFTATWPVHCIGNTAGAELHPQLVVPGSTEAFRKGMEVLTKGEDDLSYSGYYSVNAQGKSLGERLREGGAAEVVLGGLALDYCVGKTALDLRAKLGLDVAVAIDATRGIADESVAAMMRQFAQHDIQTTTTNALLAQLGAA